MTQGHAAPRQFSLKFALQVEECYVFNGRLQIFGVYLKGRRGLSPRIRVPVRTTVLQFSVQSVLPPACAHRYYSVSAKQRLSLFHGPIKALSHQEVRFLFFGNVCLKLFLPIVVVFKKRVGCVYSYPGVFKLHPLPPHTQAPAPAFV